MQFIEQLSMGIQHIDGTVYSKEDWTSAGFSNDKANGIAITRAVHPSFVFAKELLGSCKWVDSENPNFPEECIGTRTTGKGGFELTQLWVKYAKDETVELAAVKAAINYVFPNGKTGFIPSAEELALIYENRSTINSLVNLIGGSNITFDYIWSSTAASTSRMYAYVGWQSNPTSPNANLNVLVCTTL